MRVALKINTSEEGYEYGLKPVFFRTVAELVYRITKVRPTICDGIKLVDYWRRSLEKDRREKRFWKWPINKDIPTTPWEAILSLMAASVEMKAIFMPVTCPTPMIGGVEVGTAVCRSDALFVLSHVTLHPLFGLGGALLNGGFDCLIGRERTRILKGLDPYPFNGSSPSPTNSQIFNAAPWNVCSVSASQWKTLYFISIISGM